jgi:hypothetical protein
MTIAICGSMSFAQEMLVMRQQLRDQEHQVVLPHDTETYAGRPDKVDEKWQQKLHEDLIRKYYLEIEKADAILVLNLTKNGIGNYIGGNALLEMGFAHILHKPIYLLNPIPEMLYKDEIMAMNPVVLNGDVTLIHD